MIVASDVGSNRIRGPAEGASDPIGELVAMTRPTSTASVRKLVGGELYESLSRRQVYNLRWKLDVIGGWYAYCRAAGVGRGRIEEAREEFVRGMKVAWGRRISRGTLRNWQRRLKLGGAAALVDGRGRPPGSVPLDAALFLAFCRFLRRGVSLRAAHWRIRERAWQEGVWWPCLDTLRARLRERQAVVEGRPRARGNPRYLVKALSKN